MKKSPTGHLVFGFPTRVEVRPFVSRHRIVGVTSQFAAALTEIRDPTLLHHDLLSMVRQRIYGVLADYEDQNDELRTDPDGD